MNPELIYSSQKRGFLPDRRYANPRYFAGVARDVTSVIIVGSYPHIADAYRYSDPDISVVQVPDERALVEYLAKRERGEKREAVPQPAPFHKPLPVAPASPPAPSRTAETPESRALVDIPVGWRQNLAWPVLRSLAAKLSDTPINNRDDAERAIQAEVTRRAGI